MEIKFFKKPANLRKWFEKNHKKEKEVWIGFYKKETGLATITWPESVDEALCFGWIDGIRKTNDEKSYKIRFTPRNPKSGWSAINTEKAERLIKEGRMTEYGLVLIEHGKKNGKWETAYRLKDHTEPPEDFKKALNKNKKALTFFNSLSNTNKHACIGQVEMVKNKEKRTERIKQVIELLEREIKPYIGQKRAINIYFKK